MDRDVCRGTQQQIPIRHGLAANERIHNFEHELGTNGHFLNDYTRSCSGEYR